MGDLTGSLVRGAQADNIKLISELESSPCLPYLVYHEYNPPSRITLAPSERCSLHVQSCGGVLHICTSQDNHLPRKRFRFPSNVREKAIVKSVCRLPCPIQRGPSPPNWHTTYHDMQALLKYLLEANLLQ